MKILAVSDIVQDTIYSPQIQIRLQDIELILGCGDLPNYYLEYIVSKLDKPGFYVRGNHSLVDECDANNPRPCGSTDLHGRVMKWNGYLLAGIEGCLRYNRGLFQYTQEEMWLHVIRLVPGLLLNRITHGHALDILLTHAPPWGVHDQTDLPHQGIKAFFWLIKYFQPAYHFHGHIHIYNPKAAFQTRLGRTLVINAFGHRVVDL